MSTDAVVLHETGFLSAEGPLGRYDLILDDDGAEWLLLSPPSRPGAPQGVAAGHPDLDFALGLLVAAAGRPGPFRVELPCGARILRPGRVPVGEVLAAFGYAPVASLTAYVRWAGSEDASARDVTEGLSARLSGRTARVAEVEPMEDDPGAWCCAVTLPNPGLFAHGAADELVQGILGGCGLQLIGRGELDLGAAQPRPNAATVLLFSPLTVAA